MRFRISLITASSAADEPSFGCIGRRDMTPLGNFVTTSWRKPYLSTSHNNAELSHASRKRQPNRDRRKTRFNTI